MSGAVHTINEAAPFNFIMANSSGNVSLFYDTFLHTPIAIHLE
ncbi:hypothetical protein HMPREF1548_03559 [Clostridium sp. KLE 1755]|nr:hypothetical protein HMPREF1548_03559 [Clostridium sp. KLE 1755]